MTSAADSPTAAEGEVPFRRCAVCSVDSSRFATKCDACGADLTTPEQRRFQAQLRIAPAPAAPELPPEPPPAAAPAPPPRAEEPLPFGVRLISVSLLGMAAILGWIRLDSYLEERKVRPAARAACEAAGGRPDECEALVSRRSGECYRANASPGGRFKSASFDLRGYIACSLSPTTEAWWESRRADAALIRAQEAENRRILNDDSR